jgi:hypothetical protein
MVRFPKPTLEPADLLHFIELRAFTEAWDHRLALGDDELTALQILIMMQPKGAPVVSGTGGLRKLRFASETTASGKRGGIRVCYVYFEEWRTVLLVTAYAKNRKDDLSAAEKKRIQGIIGDIDQLLRENRKSN